MHKMAMAAAAVVSQQKFGTKDSDEGEGIGGMQAGTDRRRPGRQPKREGYVVGIGRGH